MDKLLANPFETTSIILFAIGFAILLLHKNLIRKIIGMNIMDTAVMLFLMATGYIDGREAPIIGDAFKGAEAYVNPIPTALMLTGIVVAVSTTALLLALTIRVYEKFGTIEVDEIFARSEDA